MQQAYVITIDDDSVDPAEVAQDLEDVLSSAGFLVITVNPWDSPISNPLAGIVPQNQTNKTQTTN